MKLPKDGRINLRVNKAVKAKFKSARGRAQELWDKAVLSDPELKKIWSEDIHNGFDKLVKNRRKK